MSLEMTLPGSPSWLTSHVWTHESEWGATTKRVNKDKYLVPTITLTVITLLWRYLRLSHPLFRLLPVSRHEEVIRAGTTGWECGTWSSDHNQ